MAKKQAFADKASKKKHVSICPVCNGEITFMKVLKSTKSANGWKVTNRPVGVCKCNEAEIYG